MLKCMTPQARPRRRSPAPGFGLVELLLALGVATAMGAAAFWVYPRVTTRVNVASDVENVRDLASRVDRSHGIVGSFRGVSTLNVLEDGLAPTDFRQGSAATMSNAWGGAVTVSPATVRLAGDAFTVGLSGLPARACLPFVSAIAGDANVRDVIVGNTSVLLGNGGTLDIPGLGLACGVDDWQDLPPLVGSWALQYWYSDAVVRLTPAEKAKLDWAINNVPIQRVETPAPMPGNWPANVSESAFYEEQCNALSDAGNIRYAYSYDFECVANMGWHYCDYNWTSGGTSLAVCRQACASDLVGKSNNPYRWEWPESSVVASTPYTTCTGQPGCTPNGGFGTQQGLPACNEHNVGETFAFNWYRQFYNPVRVDYQALTLTCRGPTA